VVTSEVVGAEQALQRFSSWEVVFLAGPGPRPAERPAGLPPREARLSDWRGADAAEEEDVGALGLDREALRCADLEVRRGSVLHQADEGEVP
jgi:hypothetical protein